MSIKNEKPEKIISRFIKENKQSIMLTLGEVTDLSQIGQGGNGLVYSGIQNNQEVAIKFLIKHESSSKLTRFKAEYFNINLLENCSKIVKYINYEEIQIEEGYSFPAIIMKKYDKSLKDLRKDTMQLNEKTFKKLFYFLIETLDEIHKKGIIHRDIKPENILVTKNEEFVLTDFGIASYNPDFYTLKAKTEHGDRLANYEFSAPEQANKDATPAPTMDIYALGQVCQWYVFGKTHKGTNRNKITEKFKSEESEIIDIILNKCLDNDFDQRYQNVSEILNHINTLKESKKELDPFDDINTLTRVIYATCPLVSKGIQFVNDEKHIKRLVKNINKQYFHKSLWFNTGRGNNTFSKLKYLEDKNILLEYRELKIKGIWLYADSGYNDLIIFETEENAPFIINEKETYNALLIDDKFWVEGHYANSGYIEIEDEVYDINEFKVEERVRSNDYKYYFIGTKFHSSIIEANDSRLRDIQQETMLTKDIICNLIANLEKDKDVLYRL